MANILVTGATGFIGKRLISKLLEEGHEVFALVRMRGISLGVITSDKLHFLYGDLNYDESSLQFPEKIDCAFYLVHSMAESVRNLRSYETKGASNFLRALAKTSCKQVIYLSGIIDPKAAYLSVHLRSRLAVERVLKSGPIPVTVLRASIIVGSGSASFEIIRDLVEKLPIMVAPKWVASLCQPIAIFDVIYYLSQVVLNKPFYNQVVDIGGPEVMSFKQVLLAYARFRNLKRWIIQVPVLTPKLSSYWLVLITSVRFSLCRYLTESMRYNSICSDQRIDSYLPHSCLTFSQALERALSKIAQNEIASTWMDAWIVDKPHQDIASYVEAPKEGCLKDKQVVSLQLSEAEVRERIWRLGGDRGWYGLDWAWRIRGLIDQLVGGTGMNRGRRHPSELTEGDSIDFWRVVKAQVEPCHLILYAEMKMPGEAWLEFKVEKGYLKQIATFRPRGLWGRLYWCAMWPFHVLIFRKMAQRLSR